MVLPSKPSQALAPLAWEETTKKTKPWWQDLSVLLLAALIIVIVVVAHKRPTLSLWFPVVSWFLLADIATYHAGVLWFDDLKPGKSWTELRVYSHRRILFQAFINFAESVFLFAVLYRYHFSLATGSSQVYQASFEVASTLSRPSFLEAYPYWLTNIQVGFSVFFLVVVIGIVASVGYKRGELAPSDSP